MSGNVAFQQKSCIFAIGFLVNNNHPINKNIMKKVCLNSDKSGMSLPFMRLRKVLTAAFFIFALTTSAQGIDKVRTFSDNTCVISTSVVKFAKSRPVFGKTQRVGMRHIAVSPTETLFAIVLPQTADHRQTLPAGRRLVLRQANGASVTLSNLRNIEKQENENVLDAIYTIYPEYIVSEAQLNQLLQSEVVSLQIETRDGGEFVTLDKLDYAAEWDFNRMLQRCYNVLRWKLAELNR